jgi:cell growth-regulating nucleolar protein
MVFFVCDGCNETLKKAKVDAHAAKCRDCYAVSCVDCSQSFPGGKLSRKRNKTITTVAHDGSHLFARLDIHIHPWVQSNCFN